MVDETPWTLDELSARAALALGPEDGPASGRVRAVPDARTVRYYQGLGLVDRPLVRGRVAYYGPRQLAQVVAIKRLQAEGLPLAEVQARLAGLAPAALAALARLDPACLASGPVARPAAPAWEPPAPAGAPSSAQAPGEARSPASVDVTSDRRRRPFWGDDPAPAPPPLPQPSTKGPGAAAVRLAPGVVLVLDGVAPLAGVAGAGPAGAPALTPDLLEALRRAAAPLLETLHVRGLLADRVGEDPRERSAP